MPRRFDDASLEKPMPNAAVPWLVMLVLAAVIILVKMWAFGAPDALLGDPPPRNEYEHHLRTPDPATPPPGDAPTPAASPAGAPHAGNDENDA